MFAYRQVCNFSVAFLLLYNFCLVNSPSLSQTSGHKIAGFEMGTKSLPCPPKLWGISYPGDSLKFLNGTVHRDSSAFRYQMAFSSDKDVKTLLKFFRENLAAHGWKFYRVTESSIAVFYNIRCHYSCYITAYSSGIGSHLDITYSNVFNS